jgi:DNA polymerase-3 subunit delta
VLERLIERPPPGLYLVLTAAASRESDLSRPLLASIRNHGSVEKSVTYDDYEPVEWVLKESRARGVNLDRPGAELFIHLAGNNLGRLAAELDKLSLLHGQGPPPDEAALVRAVHGSQRASLFLITDRLGVRDLAGALGVLEHFLADTPGEHPVLIGILSRFFRQLLHLQSLRQQGVSEADWASRLKLPPFIVRKLAAQARRFAPGELEAILRALAGLELTLRRHAHLTGPLFREFLHAVCREGFDPSGKAGPFLGSGLAGRA